MAEAARSLTEVREHSLHPTGKDANLLVAQDDTHGPTGRRSSREPARALGIVADDLSGAAECAAHALMRVSRSSVVRSPRLHSGPRADHAGARARAVLTVDTDSRRRRRRGTLPARCARQRASSRAAPVVVKKVDSLLRGHVAAEVAALADELAPRPGRGRRESRARARRARRGAARRRHAAARHRALGRRADPGAGPGGRGPAPAGHRARPAHHRAARRRGRHGGARRGRPAPASSRSATP